MQTVSSKARSRFQRLAVATAALVTAVMAGAGDTMPDGRRTPSGYPVPRWLSLRSDEVHARAGPGRDYRILWAYRAEGLPVQVVAETKEWRKICDPDGAVAWVHFSLVNNRRNVFNPSDQPLPIRARRSDAAPVRARLSPRALASVDECRGGWCEVRVRRLHGWVRERSVFGTASTALCSSARPAGPGRQPVGPVPPPGP